MIMYCFLFCFCAFVKSICLYFMKLWPLLSNNLSLQSYCPIIQPLHLVVLSVAQLCTAGWTSSV